MSMILNKAEKSLISQLENAGAKNIAQSLAKTGLPTRRVESYHYTDLKMLLDDVPDSGVALDIASESVMDIADSYKVFIINGEPKITAPPPSGAIIRTDSDGILNENNDVIIQLNSVLTKETLTIEIENKLEKIIHIDRRGEGKANHINGAVELSILDNASATIIETFSGTNEAHFNNHASKVTLGKNANLTHIMLDLSGNKVRHFQTIFYDIKENSNLRSLIIHDGSDLARTQLFATFSGENSHADLSGLSLVDDGQHSDITIDVAHNVPNTTSTEMFKSVVRGRSKAIFQGKIIVAKDAQKTDAKMMTQGLMLSDDAEILAKPELEIFADDVICGHGATCGELDENSLFYLMSRGIKFEQAKSMLVRAFLAELFDPIKGENLQQALINIADEWLAREKGQEN